MQIPPVTIEDLQAFHTRHFPTSAQDNVPGTAQLAEADNDVDGLGSYPDGKKRTLTDEQIAIFRHSEIQALLREDHLRQEEAAAQQDADTDPNAVEEEKPNSAHQDDHPVPLSTSTTTVHCASGNDTRPVPLPKDQSYALSPAKRNRAQKRDRSKPWTYNREARELDEIRTDATTAVVLDY